jgi:hypothetical protein
MSADHLAKNAIIFDNDVATRAPKRIMMAETDGDVDGTGI